MKLSENIADKEIPAFIENIASNSGSLSLSQPFACVLPSEFHKECAVSCAKKILCFSGTGEDSCPACLGWVGDSHPDLVFFGKPDEPPGIEECRKIWEELSLKPCNSRKRVGVIHAADRLSLPAANSLLKITEEMPSTGTLMLLMEDNAIIPTLRSRLRVFHFRVCDRGHIPEKAPAGVVDFIKWAGKTRKNDPRDLISDLENWVSFFVSGNDLGRAANLDLVCVLAERGKLTTPMIQDLAMASLEGEVQLEELFSDIW